MEKCCKCGKEAVLNDKGMCFDCADTGGIKLTEMQKAGFSKSVAVTLFLIFSVVNIRTTYSLLGRFQRIDGIILIGYVIIAIGITYVKLEWCKPEYKYPCWEKPTALILIKYIVSFILGSSEDVAFLYMMCFVIIWAVIEILFSIIFYKRNRNFKQNWVLQHMENRLSDIPKTVQEFPTLSDNEYQVEFRAEVDYAVDVVQCSDWEDEVKEKVIELIQDRNDELWVDNKIKSYYCRVVENCMDAAFREDENGNWINEIMSDINSGFKIASESEIENGSKIIIAGDYETDYYSTQGLFEMFQTARIRLLIPWKCYLEWEKEIGISQHFQEFRSESIGVSLGETGEQRVAMELQPYEGQIIVLPNLRLEVDGESIENDFVLISPYGIYVLEVKNLGSGGGYGLYIEKDGRWNKVRGRNMEYMESPVHQNERHILYLEKYINAELGKNLDNYLRVQGIVVIANDKADIKNESDHLILRYKDIMSNIRRQPVVMKEEEMKKIAGILQKAGLEPKKYPIANYFNYYCDAKLFTNEYLFWKESTEKLKKYVDEYMLKNINSKGVSCI